MVLDLIHVQVFRYQMLVNSDDGRWYMSSLVHIDNRKTDILILDEGLTDGLDGTTLTAEKINYINFTEPQKKICLSLHYNLVNSHIFANGVEFSKFTPDKASKVTK